MKTTSYYDSPPKIRFCQKAKAVIFNRWMQMGLRLILGGVFMVAGAMKVSEPLAFADNIEAFQLLPNELITITALSLPIFEILVGGLLILRVWTEVAAVSILGLTGIFAVALGSALARGLKVDCGCFGEGEASAWGMWISLGRDIALGGIAWLVLKGEGHGHRERCRLDGEEKNKSADDLPS